MRLGGVPVRRPQLPNVLCVRHPCTQWNMEVAGFFVAIAQVSISPSSNLRVSSSDTSPAWLHFSAEHVYLPTPPPDVLPRSPVPACQGTVFQYGPGGGTQSSPLPPPRPLPFWQPSAAAGPELTGDHIFALTSTLQTLEAAIERRRTKTPGLPGPPAAAP